MTPYEQIKDALIWQPLIAGLEVIEPKSTLDINMTWVHWDACVKAQDDLAEYANKHIEECR